MRTVVSCNNEANISAIRTISGKFNWSWYEKRQGWLTLRPAETQLYQFFIVVLCILIT
jgi:hypothetical protein